MDERTAIADFERRLADAEAALRQANERVASGTQTARVRLNAFLVRFQELVRYSLNPGDVAAAACRLVTEELGVDRAYWSEIDWTTREFVIGADYAASGAEPISGRFPLDAWEPFSSYHLEGRPVVVGNTTTDPRITPDLLRGYEALGIKADLAVPVLAGDKLRSVLAVNQSAPRKWTPDDVELVQSAADWCWAAVERVRSEATVRESEKRQAFLLTLSDALRPLADPADIQAETTRLLREQQNAGWCYYVGWDLDREIGLVLRDSVSEGLPSLAGAHDVSDAPEFLKLLAAGSVLTVRDYASYELLPQSIRQKFTALGFRSMMAAPLVKEGRLIATLLVGDTELRDWSAGDTSIIIEVAERTWAAIERGRAEAALRESEHFRSRIIESSRDCIKILDQEGVVLWVSEQGLKALECEDSRSLVGHSWIETWSDDMRATVASAIAGTAAGGEHHFSGWSRTVKGTDRYWDVIMTPLANLSGKPERLLAVSRDLTERRRADEALRESEERFAQFANASAAGLWIRVAGTLAMEFVSPAIASIYGVGQDALLGDVARWAAMIVPEDRDVALGHLEKARVGEIAVHEFRIQRPMDGSFRWIRNTDFPLFDAQGQIQRIGGIAQDVTEGKLAVEHTSVLLAELQHRVRNIMGMIRSMANRTAPGAADSEDYRALLEGRLLALARVQALLTRQANAGGSLRDVIESEVEAQAHHGGQFTLIGPNITLSPKAVEVLTLAFHELATNALKYGALSTSTGRLSVTWTPFEKRGRSWLSLDWVEDGAPPREPSTRRGFGSELIEGRIPYELGGRGAIAIGEGGARCHLEFPLKDGESILETDAPQPTTVFGGSLDMSGAPDLTGRRILVVEDDYFLAADTAAALRGAGAEVLGPCPTEERVHDLLEEETPTHAVLDLNLGGGGPQFGIAHLLKARGVPFVFLTGYDPNVIPPDLADVIRLQKPLPFRAIVEAVGQL